MEDRKRLTRGGMVACDHTGHRTRDRTEVETPSFVHFHEMRSVGYLQLFFYTLIVFYLP